MLLFVQQDCPTALRAIAMCRRFLRQPGDCVVLAHINTGSEASGRRLMDSLDMGSTTLHFPAQLLPCTLVESAPSLPRQSDGCGGHDATEDDGSKASLLDRDEVQSLSVFPDGVKSGVWLKKMLIPVAQEGVLATMIKEIEAIGPEMVAVAEAWEESYQSSTAPRSLTRYHQCRACI